MSADFRKFLRQSDLSNLEMVKKLAQKLRVLIGTFILYKNPVLPLADYFRLLPAKTIEFDLRNGLKFKARTRNQDFEVIKDIFIHHMYDPPDFNLGEPAIAIDIGAHIGIFSVWAATKFPGAKILAFEPQPENFSLLQENIIINHLESRVTPIKKAVATERKDAYLWFRDRESMGGGTLWPEYLGSAKSERVLVNCLSLPDIFAEYRIGKIDFLKLDCEGAEFDILESLPAEYFNKIGAISLEYHENLELGRTAAELRAILENNGFKTTTNQSLIYALRELPI